jgi:glycosyltransferase involved in cell wall biosynthesis
MNIISPVDSYTGYGITGYNIWRQIYYLNNNSLLFPIGNINAEKGWDIECIKNGIGSRSHFDKSAPSFKLWHANDFFTKTHGDGKYGVLSFFEIDKLTEIEQQSYNIADIIFMPSEWAKNVLQNNGIKKDIIVCPMGVDTSIFNAQKPEDKKNKNTYIFINIGKFEIRKGHDILVDLFNNAFNENDDVELWMINHNPFLNQDQIKQWINLYNNSKLSSKIRFFPRIPDQISLAQIMSYADCGIFPSRAEGWNNEAIEMMAMDKPIIITNYSAHTQFCNKDNAYLVDIDTTVPANDGIWFNGSGNWASIEEKEIDQFIEHMRYVYKNNIRDNSYGLKTANNLSWHNTANIIYSNMIN